MPAISSASQSSEQTANDVGLPWTVAEPALVAYRSAGIGAFGAAMRWAGMPLEKIALYVNSSQVTGRHPFGQAARLAFRDGWLAPYRVVGPASVTAWFLQYSVMGIAFQFVDSALSRMMGVRPVYYGKELMEPPPTNAVDDPLDYKVKTAAKTIAAPVLASAMESAVSNRAEVQRYFGPDKFARLEEAVAGGNNALRRALGPAFAANAMRNVIMCQTSFVLTPVTYKLYFPQEQKSKSTLFWYGLGLNVFVGNAAAITQQALWGRSLDYLSEQGRISYSHVVRRGLAAEGWRAFFTGPKWFSRVLMNAPAQGTLPWFYNEVLPLAEYPVLQGVKLLVYDPLLAPGATAEPTVLNCDQHHHHNRFHHRMPTVTITRRPSVQPHHQPLEHDQERQEPHQQQQPEITAVSPR